MAIAAYWRVTVAIAADGRRMLRNSVEIAVV